MPPEYPLPWKVVISLAWAVLARRQRSFRKDAGACIAYLNPPLLVIGEENLPAAGSFVVTVNHYSRPGFGAWWLALSISAALPYDIHWIMSRAWTYPPGWRSSLLTPATRWLFERLAGVYGFTSMPPMPPAPHEVKDRAAAVRRVLRFARQNPFAVIGLAPEGGDTTGGALGAVPSGVGRFLFHLANQGFAILPVGAYEQDRSLCLRFGKPYFPEFLPPVSQDEIDRFVSQRVMAHIAELLPDRMDKPNVEIC